MNACLRWLCFLLCLTPCVAATAIQPRISGVSFVQTSQGRYMATISGLHFGAVPSGIPCTGCATQQIQVVNSSFQPLQQNVDVSAWSDSSIILANIQAGPGDSLRIAVYNEAAAKTAAWGGVTAPNTFLPTIKSVTTSGLGAARVITVTGKGFGPSPALGANIDTPFLVITDWDVAQPASSGFPWNGGFCGIPDCNGVTANYTSWTDTQIVISGFGNDYGSNGWTISSGDSLCAGVWPSTSRSNGTWGGRFYCTRAQ